MMESTTGLGDSHQGLSSSALACLAKLVPRGVWHGTCPWRFANHSPSAETWNIRKPGSSNVHRTGNIKAVRRTIVFNPGVTPFGGVPESPRQEAPSRSPTGQLEETTRYITSYAVEIAFSHYGGNPALIRSFPSSTAVSISGPSEAVFRLVSRRFPVQEVWPRDGRGYEQPLRC